MNLLRTLAGVVAIVACIPAVAPAQTVTKVPSGDAVVISGVGKVRLLGVRGTDEPAFRLGNRSGPPAQPRTDPTQPAPPAVGGAINLKRERPSRTFLQQLVLGKTVRIQYDELVGTRGSRRAYIFLDDGTLVNAEMLRAGKARVDTSTAFAHEAEFKRLEDEARRTGVGIWAEIRR